MPVLLGWRWILYPAIFALAGSILPSFLLILMLRPFRRSVELPWYERARLLYPAVHSAQFLNFILFLGALICAGLIYESSFPVPKMVFLALCVFGGVLGSSVYAWVSSRLTKVNRTGLTLFLRGRASVLAGVLTGYLTAYFIFDYCRDMPYGAIRGTLFTFLFVFVLAYYGWALFFPKLFGLIVPASPRSVEAVERAAKQSGIVWRPKVLEMRTPLANAFAQIRTRTVYLTTGLLEILDDQELQSICLHEISHLKEKKSAQLQRFIPLLIYFVFLGAWPTFMPKGIAMYGFIPAMVIVAVLVRWLSSRISHKLERAADEGVVSGASGADSAYAAALCKLYERSMYPAVQGKRFHSHPNLYDRMEQAGVTPPFPRPKPPSRARTILGSGMAILLMIAFLFVLFLFHYRAYPYSLPARTHFRHLHGRSR